MINKERDAMKKKIIIAVDNNGWCYTTTAKSLVKVIPEYDFEILTKDEFNDRIASDKIECDLLFIRGYVNHFVDETNICKVKMPMIISIATGGVNVDMRIKGMRRLGLCADGFYVQNKFAENKLKDAGYNNIFLVPNGVDCNKFHPPEMPVEKEIAGIAGNMYEDRADLKGRNFVIEACKSMGVEYSEVNADINRLSHDEMADWYRSLKYYIQPSEAEGCSSSVFEAMATGIPVFICEGVGYHGEICLDGFKEEDGEVTFVYRNTGSISANLILMRDCKGDYERISNNAREFAKQHSWENVAHRFKWMFDSVLSKNNYKNKEEIMGNDDSGFKFINVDECSSTSATGNNSIELDIKDEDIESGQLYLAGMCYNKPLAHRMFVPPKEWPFGESKWKILSNETECKLMAQKLFRQEIKRIEKLTDKIQDDIMRIATKELYIKNKGV